MTALAATQRWMHEALIFPRRAPAGETERRLLASPRLTAAQGLAIYQRGYFLRIAACMREQFPALCHALEEPLFNDFVADYIRAHPPERHTLYDLGRRFPAFLDSARPDRDLPVEERESWIDFMVDLAGFERLVFAMFDAPGHEGRPFATAATPDGRLRLQPAFALGSYRYPVAAYYHAVRQQQPAPLLTAAPSHVALVRTDYVTRTIPLSDPHYRFLEAVAEGGTVEHGLAALGDEARALFQSTRQHWLDWGFFIEA